MSRPHPILNPWDLPFLRHGWQCDECGHLLVHSDLLGRYEGPIFRILGYQCLACGHEIRKEPILDNFNWKILMSGRSSCLYFKNITTRSVGSLMNTE